MANYNCADSSSNAYGAGDFGTCATSTQTVGAPNTGVFQQFVDSGSFTVIIPLAVAIVVTLVATLVIKRRQRNS